jgi:hypothetical protein
MHGASLNQYIVHLLSAGAVKDESADKLKDLTDQVQKVQWQLAKLNNYLSGPSLYPVQGTYGGASTVNVSAQTFSNNVVPTGPVFLSGLGVFQEAFASWGENYNSPAVAKNSRTTLIAHKQLERAK